MHDPHHPDPIARREAHVAAQHWQQAWQAITNSQPIPRRDRQLDCHVAVQAHLVWADDGPQTVTTHAYAWTARPTLVLVEVLDRRAHVHGAWLHPWDVAPADGPGAAWTTTYGTRLPAPPWAR